MKHNIQQNTVKVVIDGKEITARQGTIISSLVSSLDMPCAGHGKCGKCKVTAKGNLSELTGAEIRLLTKEELSSGVRLACSTSVLGDCEITTRRQENAKEQIVTDGAMPDFTLSPTFSRYGIAVDIGTTTLAAKLFDTSGNMLSCKSARNPQRDMGADVISRIEASMNSDEERHRLKEILLDAIDGMVNLMSADAGISSGDIDAAVITGNTAMLYFLTASRPDTLARAPFAADRLFGEWVSAKDLGLFQLSEDAKVYLPPCIEAFVGADTVCALLSTGLCDTNDTSLLADIGTNGELALWNNKKLYVCSTAAGPAFEGAGISMGMSGSAGAIDRIGFSGTQPDIHIIGDTEPIGICGSGLIDAVAYLLKNGELDESGYLEDSPVTICDPVAITQQDIRALQLAKSAICAGIHTLLKTVDITTESVLNFYIAGGFGNYLNMKNAARIGLIPQSLLGRERVVGNAALSGAAMLLLCKEYLKVCESIAKNAQVVPLSSNPVFSDLLIEGLLF